MEAVAAAGLFLVGLVLMIRGGGLFVEASVDLAEAWGVPRFLVGATVVSLATTLPEITVSALGVLQGKADLAVGNAVGSVTANLGLILGLCVLVSPPAVRRGTFAPRALAMVLAAALLGLVSRGGVLTWPAGLPLLVLFALFVRGSIREARASVLEAPWRPAGAGWAPPASPLGSCWAWGGSCWGPSFSSARARPLPP